MHVLRGEFQIRPQIQIMTYTEFKEAYWTAEDKDRPAIMEKLTPAERTAWDVLEMLRDRKGFDWWWEPRCAEGIPEECNDEIFAEMAKIISQNTES